MNRKNILILGILIVGLIGAGAFIYSTFFSGTDLSKGSANILVLAVDETEERPGMGAVDMAFLVQLENGSVVNYTPIYPGKMRHPTQPEPDEPKTQGAGSKMLLHDSLWDKDTVQGMKYAQEIVEHHTGKHPDAVVAINNQAIDSIIKSAGDLEIKNNNVNGSGLWIVREEEYFMGKSRGESVSILIKALSTASKNSTKRNAMLQTAIDQYSNGNIIMYPSGSFMSLATSKGIGSIQNI